MIVILYPKSGPEIRDPIDECMLHFFSLLAPRLKTDVVTLHDFQLSPARRPKILVQTAGHVSGAATFYQPKVSLAMTMTMSMFHNLICRIIRS